MVGSGVEVECCVNIQFGYIVRCVNLLLPWKMDTVGKF